MSDFTKEELRELKYWLERADDSVDPIDHYNLMTKLELMINDHCYHENTKQCSISGLKGGRVRVGEVDNSCAHEWKKYLDKSGMFFHNMCHKCREVRSFKEVENE